MIHPSVVGQDISCQLHEIMIPPGVRAIKQGAFYRCLQLNRVTLDEGLEEIGEYVLQECSSLRDIIIPQTVKGINDSAYISCLQSTRSMDTYFGSIDFRLSEYEQYLEDAPML